MRIKAIFKFCLYVIVLQTSFIKVSAQSTVYSPLYNSSNFVKTIDFSKPVGEIGGSLSPTSSGGISYTIPIFTCPSTNGLEPSISISYNSQGGTGVAGYGWNISGLSSITRSGKNIYNNGKVQPVSYSFEDNFTLDGMRLVQYQVILGLIIGVLHRNHNHFLG